MPADCVGVDAEEEEEEAEEEEEVVVVVVGRRGRKEMSVALNQRTTLKGSGIH